MVIVELINNKNNTNNNNNPKVKEKKDFYGTILVTIPISPFNIFVYFKYPSNHK